MRAIGDVDARYPRAPEAEGRQGVAHRRPEIGARLLEHVQGPGTLQCDQRGLVARVAKIRVARCCGAKCLEILSRFEALQTTSTSLGGALVDDEVVEDRALLVAAAGVHRLAVFDPVEVVGHQMVHESCSVLPSKLELPHVGHVEEARSRTNGLVLGADAGVLDRHLPAGERDHPPSEPLVFLVQRRPLFRRTHWTTGVAVSR